MWKQEALFCRHGFVMSVIFYTVVFTNDALRSITDSALYAVLVTERQKKHIKIISDI